MDYYHDSSLCASENESTLVSPLNLSGMRTRPVRGEVNPVVADRIAIARPTRKEDGSFLRMTTMSLSLQYLPHLEKLSWLGLNCHWRATKRRLYRKC